VEFVVTAGQEADVTHAEELLADHRPGAVIADKGYDSDRFAGAVAARGAGVVIPPLKCRKAPREIDRVVYKERNLAERFINRIKHYRRVATRYDKTPRNFLAFVHVAAIMVLLR
jgi:transposase